jgi:hypothetical protein
VQGKPIQNFKKGYSALLDAAGVALQQDPRRGLSRLQRRADAVGIVLASGGRAPQFQRDFIGAHPVTWISTEKWTARSAELVQGFAKYAHRSDRNSVKTRHRNGLQEIEDLRLKQRFTLKIRPSLLLSRAFSAVMGRYSGTPE